MVGKNRIIYFFITTALVMGAVACEKEPTSSSTDAIGSQEITTLADSEINGTTISSDNDVAGLIKDAKTGLGIAGVAVSDGYQVVVTDENGVYQMARNSRCRKIYYTTPAAYKISLDATNHLPAFFSEGTLTSSRKYRIDFELEPLDAIEENFSLVMIGDPQCSNVAEMGRYKKETIGDIKSYITEDRYPNAYAITLGDVTFDATNMYSSMVSSMANCDINGRYLPFFQCIGNHDHDSTVSDSDDNELDDYNATAAFFNYFGPTDYSFDRGKAHIVVMDNVLVTSLSSSSKPNGKTWNYGTGGLRASQVEWLKQDIAAVENPEEKLLVICFHIPIRSNRTYNNDQIISIAQQFNEAHIMIGHTHYPQNYIQSATSKNGQKIYEHIHQAACGAWWYCNSSVTGAPNGYNVYSIEGNQIVDWVNKGSLTDEDYQVRVYDGDQAFSGTKKYDYYWKNASNTFGGITAKGNTHFENAFVAEVWDDDSANWTVEFYQNGSKVGNFTRISNGYSCNVAIASYFFNELDKTTSTYVSTTASHYWYYVPSSKSPSTETNWEVRATQTIPSSGKVKTYTCNKLTTDFSEF